MHSRLRLGDDCWPLPNVWLGTSVENQRTADERITHLLQCPAAVRFLSCEPLLGPVDLRNLPFPGSHHRILDALTAGSKSETPWGIDWVIAGGESGPGARPMHPAWARSLRDQCQATEVAFHFKQWGRWAPWDDDCYSLPAGEDDAAAHDNARWLGVDGDVSEFASAGAVQVLPVGKKAAGRILDGRTWDEFPAEVGQ